MKLALGIASFHEANPDQVVTFWHSIVIINGWLAHFSYYITLIGAKLLASKLGTLVPNLPTDQLGTLVPNPPTDQLSTRVLSSPTLLVIGLTELFMFATGHYLALYKLLRDLGKRANMLTSVYMT